MPAALSMHSSIQCQAGASVVPALASARVPYHNIVRRRRVEARGVTGDQAQSVHSGQRAHHAYGTRVCKQTKAYLLEQEVFGSNPVPTVTDVRHARSWRDMRELLAAAYRVPGTVDALFAATALHTLPKLLHKSRGLTETDRQEVSAATARLVSKALLPGVELLSADQIVHAAVALAKLGHEDERAFQELSRCSVAHMERGELSAQGLSNLAWALATVSVRPTGAWLTTFWRTLEEQMEELGPQDIANMFWSICRLELMPPWVSDASATHLLATALRRVGGTQTGQDPATVMVCLAIWSRAYSYHPPEELLSELLAAMQPNLSHYLPQDLVSIVHSLVVMNATPSRAWMTSFYVVLRDRLIFDPTLSVSDFQRLLWALSRIDYVPSQAWLRHFVEVSVVKLQHLRFRALSELVWALACWGYTPTREWLQEWFAVTQTHLAEFRPHHLANTILALKKLGCKVPSPWLDTALVSFCAQLRDAKAHDLVTFLDSMVDLCEDASWMSRPATGQRLRALADHAASKFDYVDPLMHAKLLLALAAARIVPGQAWVSAQQDSLARSLGSEAPGVITAETAGDVRRAYATWAVPVSDTLAHELELKSS